MIKFNGTWRYLDSLGKEELEKLRTPQARAVTKAALYFERKIKEKLKGPRHGRMYFTGSRRQGRNSSGRFTRRGQTHQASAPGEPPATNTGQFRQSITHGIVIEGDKVTGEVGTDAVQARILEYGGIANHARILPRPLWEVTWIEEQGNLQDILDESVKA